MCKHGTTTEVVIINKTQLRRQVPVDSCIAEEIQQLNIAGIKTLGCCCGHGKAGEITEYFNVLGRREERNDPPNALIHKYSVDGAKRLGYKPFPYHYADGESNGVWQMYLKTGCVTHEDVEAWHSKEGSE